MVLASFQNLIVIQGGLRLDRAPMAVSQRIGCLLLHTKVVHLDIYLTQRLIGQLDMLFVTMSLFHQLKFGEFELSAQFLELFLMRDGQVFQFIGRVRFELHLSIVEVTLSIAQSVFDISLFKDCLHLLILNL